MNGTPTTSTKGRGVQLGYALTAGGAPANIGRITQAPKVELVSNDTEITNADSPDETKEFTPGFSEVGDLETTIVYSATVHTTLLAQFQLKQYWTVTMSSGAKFQMYGYLKKVGATIIVEGENHTEISIKNAAGKPVFTPA